MKGSRKIRPLSLYYFQLLDLKLCRSFKFILIISPGLMFVQKAFLVGFFSRELIFRGAYYWREFCILKWVGRDNKNC